MRVFLDTNIIVDFYAQREGHYLQWLSANSCNADVIVTRDKHFRDYQGNIKTPDQFLDDYFDN